MVYRRHWLGRRRILLRNVRIPDRRAEAISLEAIMIWEGISDIYREVNAPGGIPNVPFQHFWMNMTRNGLGMTEDHAAASIEYPLFDEYW
ncbi:PepX_C domain-containing protein [Fusarium phalaenopsidis]